MLQRTASLLRAARGGRVASTPISRAFSPSVAWCEEEKDAPPEKTPEEVQAIVDKQIAEFNRTVTPWSARPEISPSQVQASAPGKEATILSAHTEEHLARTVIIQQPPRNAMQEGKHTNKAWELRFQNRERWVNPLMGWASTADPHSNTHLHFGSREAAVRFAEKNGWAYEVEETGENTRARLAGTKAYGHNFLSVAVENRLKNEGVKGGIAQFQHATGRMSHFTKTLKYHGDGEVAQHGGDRDYSKETA